MSTTAIIRPAELADLPAITDIYNDAILGVPILAGAMNKELSE